MMGDQTYSAFDGGASKPQRVSGREELRHRVKRLLSHAAHLNSEAAHLNSEAARLMALLDAIPTELSPDADAALSSLARRIAPDAP